MTRIFDMLRAPPGDDMRRYRYARETAYDFRVDVARAGLTLPQIARLTGKPLRKVMTWYDNAEAPPTWIPAMMALLAMPGADDVAFAVANFYTAEDGSMNRMTPNDFGEDLAKVRLSVGQFARLTGIRYNGPVDSTANRWLAGRQDIPPWVPVFTALLSRVGGVERAREAAERYIIEEDS